MVFKIRKNVAVRLGNDNDNDQGGGLKKKSTVVDLPYDAEDIKLVKDGEQNPETAAARRRIEIPKRIGVLEALTIVMGCILGSGIYVSPTGVLDAAGSAGLSLIVWIICGLITIDISYIYVELGMTIPLAGGEYSWLKVAFGPWASFLFLWHQIIGGYPAILALLSLVYTENFLSIFYIGECPEQPPDSAVRLFAAATILFLAYLNCTHPKFSLSLQHGFTIIKILTLVIILICGVIFYFTHDSDRLSAEVIMSGSHFEAENICLAIFNGLFSFGGLGSLFYIVEEIKNPTRTLPISMGIGISFITAIYVFTNAAYFAVLDTDEMLTSSAVAVTFAKHSMGRFWYVMPILVALSIAGSLNGIILSCSRIFYAGAKNGQLPQFLCLINVSELTPIPSILFLCGMTVVLLCELPIYELLSFAVLGYIILQLALNIAIVWMRFRGRAQFTWVAVIFSIFNIFLYVGLTVLPFFNNFWPMFWGAVIVVSGVPVYLVLFHWHSKPQWCHDVIRYLTIIGQKLLMCTMEKQFDDSE